MSTSDGTMQLTDNQDPSVASASKGRLFWDDNLKQMFQIDSTGAKTNLINNTSGAFFDIDSSLSSIQPFLSGGVYTFPNNTNFRFIDQVYNFGNNTIDFSHVNGCYFLSASCVPTITYTGTGSFLTNSATGTLLNIERMFLNTPNGRVFNLTGNSGVGNSLITKLVILLNQNFASIITDFEFLTIELTITIGSKAGILATNVDIQNVLSPQFNDNQDVGGTFLTSAGTGTLLKIDNVDSRPESSESFLDIQASYTGLTSINGGVHIEDGSFFKVGSRDQKDAKIFTLGVVNVPMSRTEIFGHFAGNAVATVISTINTPVKINAGTGWTDVLKERFTFTSDGRWTYTGLEDIDVSLSLSATVNPSGGGSKSISTYFAKNGIVDLNTRGNVTASAGGQITNLAIVSLVTGDFIEAFLENNSDTADITVEVASIRIP